MKTLHLLRHAKSAWDQPGLGDRDRGLNKRGRRDAPRMGEALSAEVPAQTVFVSPARRAQLTLEGLCAGWPDLTQWQHVTDEALYTFAAGDLLYWIAACPDQRDSVFIIGHNPALTELVNTLGQRVLDNLPTAGYARLLLNVDTWAMLEPGCASLEQLLLPRKLPG